MADNELPIQIRVEVDKASVNDVSRSFESIKKTAEDAGRKIGQSIGYGNKNLMAAMVSGNEDAARKMGLLMTQAEKMNAVLEKQSSLWYGINQRMGKIALLTTELTRAFFGLAAATAAVGLPAIISTKYLQTIEDAKVGIAGTLQAMSEASGAGNRWSQSMQMSEQVLTQLTNASVKYNISLDEIADTFRGIVGVGSAAGMTLQEVGRIATIGTMAVKSLNLNKTQTLQEIRDLVQPGGIQAASSTLATALNITNEMTKKWKEAGTLFENLEKRMAGYTMAALERQNTLSGALDILKMKLQRLFASPEGFDVFKKVIQDISSAIGEINYETGEIKFNPELVELMKSYWNQITAVAKAVGMVAEAAIYLAPKLWDIATVFGVWYTSAKVLPLIHTGILAISGAVAALPALFGSASAAMMTLGVTASALGTRMAALSAGAAGGIIGLALFGTYLIADYVGLVDQIFSSAEGRAKDFRDKIKGYDVEQLQFRKMRIEGSIEYIEQEQKTNVLPRRYDIDGVKMFGEEALKQLKSNLRATEHQIKKTIEANEKLAANSIIQQGNLAEAASKDLESKNNDVVKRAAAIEAANKRLSETLSGIGVFMQVKGVKEGTEEYEAQQKRIVAATERYNREIEDANKIGVKKNKSIQQEAKKDLSDFLSTQRDLYAAANSAIDAQLDAGSINLAQAYEMRNEESRKHIDVLKQTTKDKTESAKYDADLIKFQSANFEKFVADHAKSADKLKGITQSILPEDTSEVGKINKQIAELTKEYDNYASGLTKAKSELESFSNSSKPLTEAQIAQKATLEALIAKYPELSDKYNEAKKYAELFLKPLAAINDELGRAEKELGLQKDLIDLEAIKNGGTELDNFIAKQKTYGVLQEELRVKVKALTQAEQHLQDVRREFGEESTNFKSAADKVNDLRKGVIGAQKAVAGLANETDRTFGAGAKRALKNYENSLGDVATSAEQLFTKAFKSIEDAMVDAFMGAKVDVKAIFKSLLADIVRMFVRQTIMVPIVGEFMGTQGGPGAASFGSNLFGNAAGSSMAAWAGNAGFDAIYGSALHGTALGTFGESAAISMSNGAGMMANLGEAASLIGEGSIASGLGAAAPYAAAALVIADAVGAFGKRGGPQQGQYGQVGAGGYSSSFTMSGGDALGNQALSQSAYAQAAALYAMAGKKVADLTIQQGYKLDPQGSASGVAYRNILVGGKTLTGGTFDGNNGAQWTGSNSDAAGAANFLGKLSTSDFQALLKEIGDPNLSAAADALLSTFGELEKSLPAWLAAQDTQKAMTQSLMTDAEKLDATSETLHRQFAAMGMDMPTSTSGLKSLVDGLDLTTQSGQDTLASLKDLVPAFVELTKDIDDAAAAAEQAAQAAQATQASLLDKYNPMDTVAEAVAAFENEGINIGHVLNMTADQLRNFAANAISAVDPTTEAGQRLLATFQKLAPAFDLIVEKADAMKKIVATMEGTLYNQDDPAVAAKNIASRTNLSQSDLLSMTKEELQSTYNSIIGNAVTKIKEIKTTITASDIKSAILGVGDTVIDSIGKGEIESLSEILDTYTNKANEALTKMGVSQETAANIIATAAGIITSMYGTGVPATGINSVIGNAVSGINDIVNTVIVSESESFTDLKSEFDVLIGNFDKTTESTKAAADAASNLADRMKELQSSLKQTIQDVLSNYGGSNTLTSAFAFNQLESDITSLNGALGTAQITVTNLAKVLMGDLSTATVDQLEMYQNATTSFNNYISAIKTELEAANQELDKLKQLRDSYTSFGTKILRDIATANDQSIVPLISSEISKIESAIVSALPEDAITMAEELRGLYQELFNEENRLAEEQKANYERSIEFAKSIRGYLDKIRISEQSPASLEDRLREAANQFSTTLTKSIAGDAEAQQALTGISDTYLGLAKDYFASTEGYADIFNQVVTGLEGIEGVKSIGELTYDETTEIKANTAEFVKKLEWLNGLMSTNSAKVDTQITTAQQQVTYLQGIFDALGANGAIVQSINSLLANYGTKAQELAVTVSYNGTSHKVSGGSKEDLVLAAVSSINPGFDYAGAAASNPALIEAWGKDLGIPGYAKGGMANGWSIVGERGPEVVNFAQPTRVYTNEQTQGMFAPVAANENDEEYLKAVIAELQALIRQNGAGTQAVIEELQQVKAELEEIRSKTRMKDAA